MAIIYPLVRGWFTLFRCLKMYIAIPIRLIGVHRHCWMNDFAMEEGFWYYLIKSELHIFSNRKGLKSKIRESSTLVGRLGAHE